MNTNVQMFKFMTLLVNNIFYLTEELRSIEIKSKGNLVWPDIII
jgi:hypothetical protein